VVVDDLDLCLQQGVPEVGGHQVPLAVVVLLPLRVQHAEPVGFGEGRLVGEATIRLRRRVVGSGEQDGVDVGTRGSGSDRGRTAALMPHGSGWRAGGAYVTVASNRRPVDPGYHSGPERVDDIVEAA